MLFKTKSNLHLHIINDLTDFKLEIKMIGQILNFGPQKYLIEGKKGQGASSEVFLVKNLSTEKK